MKVHLRGKVIALGETYDRTHHALLWVRDREGAAPLSVTLRFDDAASLDKFADEVARVRDEYHAMPR